MFKKFKKPIFLAALFWALQAPAIPASAESVRLGDLVIEQPTIRATAPGARVGAGYLTITNMGKNSERLTGGDTAVAGKVEIHEMKMVDQVMKMKEIAGGLEIPPGETIVLQPGGYHLMFMRLKAPLAAGDSLAVRLAFETAGTIEITFHIRSIGETLKKSGKPMHGEDMHGKTDQDGPAKPIH